MTRIRRRLDRIVLLSEIGLEISPRTDPLTYPGAPAPWSSLLYGNSIFRLDPAHRAGPAAWRVLDDSADPLPLDAWLARAGSAPLALRTPVLAIGSNASPAQLASKLGSAHAAVPILSARVAGLALSHSAHIGEWGYVGYAPLRAPDAQSAMWVTWLDAKQLEIVNATENNFWLVAPPGAVTVTFPDGTRPDGCQMYRSSWGCLSFMPGQPVPAGPQRDVLERLADLPWFRQLTGTTDPAEIVDALAADPSLRALVRDGFATHQMVADDGLGAPPAHAPAGWRQPTRGSRR